MALEKKSIDEIRAALADANDETFEGVLNGYAVCHVAGLLLQMLPGPALNDVLARLQKQLAEELEEERKLS